ncbi:DUF3365 domain-containing protein [Aquabacterium sp. CECT 9606]|uniref:Tll0287-like domain-containing protein n=1 Tax=Aquabacterium sp. CECT 9606 TaxID=2845822 RepID=UPI001E5811E0|nr:DUF3365 domain-containing protein [Aquabacterium sp. CECT 9606]CAH0356052.1 hypothetical protein AQB9606_04521 [Aquabacterium sp. CECT 9606]
MFRFFERFSLRVQFTVMMTVLITVVITAVSIIGQSIVVSQTVNESRTVADMTEHIGKWASQYGGVHIKRSGGDTGTVGSYLERAVYAANAKDQAALSEWHGTNGERLSQAEEMAALGRVDAYHWKNPALIQREISDIAAASTSNAKFRLTAKSVLNKNNEANPFERDALVAIDSAFNSSSKGEQGASKSKLEYWRVERGQVLYARALIAQASCLKCHASLQSAPEFLRSNSQFNGGGGFGYEANKPAGIISVTIPLPNPRDALASSLTPAGWGALVSVVVIGLGILIFIGRKVITPVNELRKYAEELATAGLGDKFEVPEFAMVDGKTNNEVHRLGQAIAELGHSVRILYRKVRDGRADKERS